jgi:hypothetical protein
MEFGMQTAILNLATSIVINHMLEISAARHARRLANRASLQAAVDQNRAMRSRLAAHA